MLRLTPQDLNLDAAKGDALPRRTLAGVALQYNVDAVVSRRAGRTVYARFSTA
jgi:hypothetical protein